MGRMFSRPRLLSCILILLSSNINIPNFFSNTCLFKNTCHLWGFSPHLSKKKNKIITFLVICLVVNWYFLLVNWWNFIKSCLTTVFYSAFDYSLWLSYLLLIGKLPYRYFAESVSFLWYTLKIYFVLYTYLH